jgi:hypothetical protein
VATDSQFSRGGPEGPPLERLGFDLPTLKTLASLHELGPFDRTTLDPSEQRAIHVSSEHIPWRPLVKTHHLSLQRN